MKPLATLKKFILKHYYNYVESHALSCAEVERQVALNAEKNAQFYHSRAAMAASLRRSL